MNIQNAVAATRQTYVDQKHALEMAYQMRLQDAGIYFGDGLFGNLASQPGFLEIRAWRNAEAEKIGQTLANTMEGIALVCQL